MFNRKHIFIQLIVLYAGQHLQHSDIDSDYPALVIENLIPEGGGSLYSSLVTGVVGYDFKNSNYA